MKRFRGEAFLDAQNPDHYYYNATIVNISTDPDPSTYPTVTFSDNRSVPLIGDIGEYEFSVVRFTTEGAGKALPVFMPRVQLRQVDPDLTVYSMGIGYNTTVGDYDGSTLFFTGYASRYVKFATEWAGAPLPGPPLVEQDVKGLYYNVSSIQNWLDLINQTTVLCINDTTPYNPGVSTYQMTDSLLTQYNKFWNANVVGYFKIETGINDTLSFSLNGTSLTFIIPPGNYGISQLADAIQTSIQYSFPGIPTLYVTYETTVDPSGQAQAYMYFRNVSGGSKDSILFNGDVVSDGVRTLLGCAATFYNIPADGTPVLISSLFPMTPGSIPTPPAFSLAAPVITYQPTSNLFQVYAQRDIYATSVSLQTAQLYMNENTRDLFNNFQFAYLGEPNGKIYQLKFQLQPAELNVVTGPDEIPLVYITQESESSSSLWCPVQNITFCSTLIPLVPESEAPPLYVGGNAQNFGVGVSSNVSRIITDISAEKTSAYSYNGSLVYIPQGEYRIADFQGSGPLREIEVTVFWKNAIDGRLYPLPLPNGSIVSIKMLFRKKM
jgi:hypothetical protein